MASIKAFDLFGSILYLILLISTLSVVNICFFAKKNKTANFKKQGSSILRIMNWFSFAGLLVVYIKYVCKKNPFIFEKFHIDIKGQTDIIN